MSTIVFFATIADVPKDHPLYAQRKQQYENALAKVFSYSTPVHGVISETNQETQDLLSLTTYPFASLGLTMCIHIVIGTSHMLKHMGSRCNGAYTPHYRYIPYGGKESPLTFFLINSLTCSSFTVNGNAKSLM